MVREIVEANSRAYSLEVSFSTGTGKNAGSAECSERSRNARRIASAIRCRDVAEPSPPTGIGNVSSMFSMDRSVIPPLLDGGAVRTL